MHRSADALGTTVLIFRHAQIDEKHGAPLFMGIEDDLEEIFVNGR